MSNRELKYGETPWDDWSREDMLRELQRMYSACVSLRSALAITRHGERSPFWNRGGTGGDALEKGEQVLRRYEENSEDIYRAFFRYADDLLFDGLGSEWRICERGHMLASLPEQPPITSCTICEWEQGKGKTPMRPLAWSDLEPVR